MKTINDGEKASEKEGRIGIGFAISQLRLSPKKL
jgi:hypothetical protein